MYDAIIVGARCAGSPLAMLLARRGARVLVVDRSTFPSDTMNGHFIVAAGVRRLQQWGLLERVRAGAGLPALQHRYHFGPFTLAGNLSWPDGQPAFGLAPRRKRLDALLLDAAAEAGAEVRQGFAVEDLVWEGERVVGIRGHSQAGGEVIERAHIVVGADGLRSRVAAAVGAAAYETVEPRTCLYYSHFADWPIAGERALTVYGKPGYYAITFPTDDGLVCAGLGWPKTRFSRVRADIDTEFNQALDQFPGLAECVRAARRVEPFRGTADVPFYLRVPWGPGWALVGDAGCRVDPITGQGITDAFRDVDFLAAAIAAGLSGASSFDAALADYQRRRDAAVLPVYRFTIERSRLAAPSAEMQRLFEALVGNQYQLDRFAGLTAGTTPFSDFFAPDNIAQIMAAAAHPAAA